MGEKYNLHDSISFPAFSHKGWTLKTLLRLRQFPACSVPQNFMHYAFCILNFWILNFFEFFELRVAFLAPPPYISSWVPCSMITWNASTNRSACTTLPPLSPITNARSLNPFSPGIKGKWNDILACWHDYWMYQLLSRRIKKLKLRNLFLFLFLQQFHTNRCAATLMVANMANNG